MVMAAEIDVTLSVHAFEELTSVNPLDEGLLSIKMLLVDRTSTRRIWLNGSSKKRGPLGPTS